MLIQDRKIKSAPATSTNDQISGYAYQEPTIFHDRLIMLQMIYFLIGHVAHLLTPQKAHERSNLRLFGPLPQWQQ